MAISRSNDQNGHMLHFLLNPPRKLNLRKSHHLLCLTPTLNRFLLEPVDQCMPLGEQIIPLIREQVCKDIDRFHNVWGFQPYQRLQNAILPSFEVVFGL
jgi:hypothetical protein